MLWLSHLGSSTHPRPSPTVWEVPSFVGLSKALDPCTWLHINFDLLFSEVPLTELTEVRLRKRDVGSLRCPAHMAQPSAQTPKQAGGWPARRATNPHTGDNPQKVTVTQSHCFGFTVAYQRLNLTTTESLRYRVFNAESFVAYGKWPQTLTRAALPPTRASSVSVAKGRLCYLLRR